jgi:hypothetical protein
MQTYNATAHDGKIDVGKPIFYFPIAELHARSLR